ncbi:hypothetical protein [Paenibacillus xanthanilyticus]|uniref:Uncharacterized protein n=1 Tax=Paenibacillus xanthanilyticus TaxID=1783531 RepID=A0ABV8KAZ9_9BACL
MTHRADDGRSVALYPARAKTGGLTLAAAFFVVTGGFMIASDEVFIRLVGFVSAFFFAGCFLYLAYRTFKRKPSLPLPPPLRGTKGLRSLDSLFVLASWVAVGGAVRDWHAFVLADKASLGVEVRPKT